MLTKISNYFWPKSTETLQREAIRDGLNAVAKCVYLVQNPKTSDKKDVDECVECICAVKKCLDALDALDKL